MLQLGVRKVDRLVLSCQRHVCLIHCRLAKDEEVKVEKVKFQSNYDQLKENIRLPKRKKIENEFASRFETSSDQMETNDQTSKSGQISRFESPSSDQTWRSGQISRLETVRMTDRNSRFKISTSNQMQEFSERHESKSKFRILEDRIQKCEDLASLEVVIRPYAKSLTVNQLEFIYSRLDNLAKDDQISKSKVFKTLMHRTTEMRLRVSRDCLLKALKAIDLFDMTGNESTKIKKMINEVLQNSEPRIRVLDVSAEVSSLCDQLNDSDEIHRLISKLDALDEINLSERMFMVNYIIGKKEEHNQLPNEELRQLLNNLITNSTKFLVSSEDAWLYVSTLSTNHLNESTIYYIENLDKIGRILLDSPIRPNANQLKELCDVVCRASKFDIFSRLLLNYLMSNIKQIDLNFETYLLLGKFKLPFINRQLLARRLFTHHNWMQIEYLDKATSLNVIVELTLGDVLNSNSIDFYQKLIAHVNADRSVSIDAQQYERISLAKVYLHHFSKIKLIDKIKSAFDDLLVNISISGQNPHLNNEYFIIDQRLQENAYLSNGIYLNNVVAIYDRSIHDLIPLTNLKNYFHRFDQVPLKADQKLLTLITEEKCVTDYYGLDAYYGFKQRQILKHLEVMPIQLTFQRSEQLPLKHHIDNIINLMISQASV